MFIVTVNSGILSVAFANNSFVWISVTSKRKFCFSPPLNPGKHCTSKESVVWFTTEQLVGGSGGPKKVSHYDIINKYFNCNNEVVWINNLDNKTIL